MKKFLYYYGVYCFCILVHNATDYFFSDRFLDDAKEISDKIKGIANSEKKVEEKPKLRSAHIVKNKIGF